MRGRKPKQSLAGGAVAVIVSTVIVGPGLAQESANYVMERITIAAAAQQSSSPSFDMNVTFGQEGPGGSASSCNQSFVQNTGFWSIQGYSPVPVVLRAARSVVDPSDVDLTWTGSTSSFEVYRSAFPNDVLDPLNLATITPECAVTDSPPTVTIVYYLVVPIGP